MAGRAAHLEAVGRSPRGIISIMASTQFRNEVGRIWAEHFGCSPDILSRPGSTFISRQKLASSGAVYITHILAHAFVELGPSLGEEFGQSLLGIAERNPLSASLVSDVVPTDRLVSVDRGLIFHLEPGRLIEHTPQDGIDRRFLEQGDAQALSQLFDACDAGEVDDAFVAVGHEIAVGCLEGERIVSAGSGYRLNRFMDLGVLTHPAHRGRRLAPSVVAALCASASKLGVVAQYRCDVTNPSSRRVAEQRGFTKFWDTESIRLSLA